MQPTMCARCHKNLAVIFVTRLENGETKNEGLCLKCARELGIKPVDDMMKRMGITDEDIDGLTNEMMTALGNAGGMENLLSELGELANPNPDELTEEDEEEGKTATFPFLNKLFGNGQGERPGQQPAEPRGRAEEKEKPVKRKFLEGYCISLTRRAQEGKLDRIVGRDKEIERVIQILNRRQKNNPCLIGEPGVGKTAIAEGLAQRIAGGDVPYKLRDKEVYLLDLTALVAGTQFRGQFESRMKGLIEEIRKLGNIILVIDEVHNIVGAGDAEGSMNAANILKPALSRGEIQVIGATTFTEYRKHIEKDTALERRFQPVTVNEPSIDDTVTILEGIAPYYEQFHSVTISPQVLRQAVLMSERYITDRYLPDKAIDLIDEACSDVNLKNRALTRLAEIEKEKADLAKEKEVMLSVAGEREEKRLSLLADNERHQEDLQKELEALSRARQAALTEPDQQPELRQQRLDSNEARRADIQRRLDELAQEHGKLASEEAANKAYERLATLRVMELQLDKEQSELSAQGRPALTEENLARVIEQWTGIPASRVQEEEYARLARLDQRLKEHIVGQDEAVEAVTAAIRRNRVGISPKRKPVSFIFVGSTGVGKTELVKQLAQDLFNSPESLIRLDMSEFMEKHSVSRLIGSPPGYVGYDEAGQLTEKIRRKPYAVILFDEIEKAHPDVLNILLQILDDGRITDAHGRVVNFENTIIVMTSNAGSERKDSAVGFDRTADQRGKDRAMKALQDFLRPEFINRVDEVVYFHQLTQEHFKGIARIMLDELVASLGEKGITFRYDDALVDYLTEKSYSAAYGARNLRRLIQKELEDAVAMKIIESYEAPIIALAATAQDGKIQLQTL